MWAILEAEFDKANTFNVYLYGEYFDEDCKQFRFRTTHLQENNDHTQEIRKLSTNKCTKVVHIIKKGCLWLVYPLWCRGY